MGPGNPAPLREPTPARTRERDALVSQITAPAILEDRDLPTRAIVVHCVDDDRDYLELIRSGLDREDDFQVRTSSDPEAALDSLEEVDCVVSDYDMPRMDGLELLSAIRERDPDLPFVLFTNERRCEVIDAIVETESADFIAKDGKRETMELLATRVRNLVDRRIVAALASRGLVAAESIDAGAVLTRSDGTIQFANRTVGDLLGRNPDALAGQHWRALFPDAEADRLADAALPSVAEGWQWVGGVAVRCADGTTLSTRTTISGLDDDSLVFTVREHDESA